MMYGIFGLLAVLCLPGEKIERRHQFYRLRMQGFGVSEAVDTSLDMECDALDAVSPCILVFYGGRLLGGVRLLPGDVEGAVSLDPALIDTNEPHCELSRFTIDETITNRLRRAQITFALALALAKFAFGQLGYQTLYCDARYGFFLHLQKMLGDSLEQLGEPHRVKKEGSVETLVPICIRRAETKRILRRRLPALLWRQMKRGLRSKFLLRMFRGFSGLTAA